MGGYGSGRLHDGRVLCMGGPWVSAIAKDDRFVAGWVTHATRWGIVRGRGNSGGMGGLRMSYRRLYVPGATYFFTVVTYDRRPLFSDPVNVQLLREAFRRVKQHHPFTVEAIVVLPDHIHTLWTLPEGDADFSTRWRLIKTYVSRRCAKTYQPPGSASRQQKSERTVWQRRFWEHLIRNQRDFDNHVAYIHNNPVKHGLATTPEAWPHSSIHRSP
ncbi:MAG: transposase [Leptolyngbya sp. LCM1.Bin17]|nr:MAG: transposase [Leptolyngbya sp. LCM1.Bin17]